MICKWCEKYCDEKILILKIFTNFDNIWEKDKVYCSFKCLRGAIV